MFCTVINITVIPPIVSIRRKKNKKERVKRKSRHDQSDGVSLRSFPEGFPSFRLSSSRENSRFRVHVD